MNTRIDFEAARLNPVGSFARPDDIVANNRLALSQKLELLERWKEDAILLQTAAGENMAGGEPDRLDKVVKAINRLKEGLR